MGWRVFRYFVQSRYTVFRQLMLTTNYNLFLVIFESVKQNPLGPKLGLIDQKRVCQKKLSPIQVPVPRTLKLLADLQELELVWGLVSSDKLFSSQQVPALQYP